MNTTQQVPLSGIDIPESFRQYTMESVDALAQDIQRNGQIQEIVVTPKEGGRFELVAGKRRTLAMKHLNWENVRAQVMENLSELQKALIMIAENDEREDVNPFDRALSYQRALKAGPNRQELAGKLGIKEDAVSRVLSILQLAPEVTENLRRRSFSGAHLQELVRLPNAESQLQMADACEKGGWSSKVLRDKVSRFLAGEVEKPAKDGAALAPSQESEGLFTFTRKGKFLVLKTKMPAAVVLIDDAYMQDLRMALVDFVSKEAAKEDAGMDQAA